MAFAALALGGVLLLAGAVRASPALSTTGLTLMLWTLFAAGLRHPGP